MYIYPNSMDIYTNLTESTFTPKVYAGSYEDRRKFIAQQCTRLMSKFGDFARHCHTF